MRGYVVISLVLLAFTVNPERRPVVRPPQIIELTGAAIDDAIRIGTDDAATRKFLAPFQLQSHAGWGDGPMLGSFSTPFSRVVQAAAVARKEGRTFSATDVSPALVEPQLQVIAISQPALKDETKARRLSRSSRPFVVAMLGRSSH
jgi:hypothetical protein